MLNKTKLKTVTKIIKEEMGFGPIEMKIGSPVYPYTCTSLLYNILFMTLL